ncbi:MAG: signal peptidase I [Lachnospiraceae bacterium]|nr:signal peptidase I [Lachnospiraceae bacterium]
MNIDDILNENIEEVVRTSVVERVHIPASEADTVSDGGRKEAVTAAKTADKAANNAAKKAADTVSEAVNSVASSTAKKVSADIEEAASAADDAVEKAAKKTVKKAAEEAESKTEEAVERKTEEAAERVSGKVVGISESAAQDIDVDDIADDDDDDDDDDEYVVHNAFSEDGTMIAGVAVGKAGAKSAAEPAAEKKVATAKSEKAAAKARKRRDHEEYDEDDEAYPYGVDDDEEYSYDGDDVEGEYDEELIDPEDEEEEEHDTSFLRMVAGDAIFLVAVFAFFLVLLYIFPPYIVDGPSMQKTLVDKAFGFGYRYATPERGDIVIVNTGDRAKGTNGESFIKRVIGVPGDTIQCIYEKYDYDVTLSDGTVVKAGGNVYRVYLNGEMLYEPYAWFGDINTAREIKEPITLGEDEYFVMGDNRFNSNDSRAFGPVSRSDIKCTMMVFLIGKHNPE